MDVSVKLTRDVPTYRNKVKGHSKFRYLEEKYYRYFMHFFSKITVSSINYPPVPTYIGDPRYGLFANKHGSGLLLLRAR